MAELVDRVEQIMARAEEIDDALASLLGRVERGEISDQGATTLAAAAQAGIAQGVEQPPVAPEPTQDVERPRRCRIRRRP